MPQAIVDKYSEELQNHRLRHEITALILTNAAINEGGISFVYRLCDRLHVTPEKVIKAYWIIRNICNLNEFMQQVHALDNKVSADIQTKLYRILRDVVYAQTRWFLLNHNSDMSIVDAIAFYKQNAEDLFETLPQTLSIQKQHKLAEKTQYFVEHGVDAKLAEQILALSFMYHAGDVLDIANSSKVQPKHVATCYNLIADRLQLSLLRDQTVELEVSDQYERIALDSVVADLDRIMRQVTQQAIEAGKTDSYKNWEAKNASLINYAEEIIKDVLESESLGLAKLSIVTSALRRKL
jgi:glutamate dehydrogenase